MAHWILGWIWWIHFGFPKFLASILNVWCHIELRYSDWFSIASHKKRSAFRAIDFSILQGFCWFDLGFGEFYCSNQPRIQRSACGWDRPITMHWRPPRSLHCLEPTCSQCSTLWQVGHQRHKPQWVLDLRFFGRDVAMEHSGVAVSRTKTFKNQNHRFQFFTVNCVGSTLGPHTTALCTT